MSETVNFTINKQKYSISNTRKSRFTLCDYKRFQSATIQNSWHLATPDGQPSQDRLVIGHVVSAKGVNKAMVAVVRNIDGVGSYIYKAIYESTDALRDYEQSAVADLADFVAPCVELHEVTVDGASHMVYFADIARNHTVLVGIDQDVGNDQGALLDNIAAEAIDLIERVSW